MYIFIKKGYSFVSVYFQVSLFCYFYDLIHLHWMHLHQNPVHPQKVLKRPDLRGASHVNIWKCFGDKLN